jgi:hypothetical protein
VTYGTVIACVGGVGDANGERKYGSTRSRHPVTPNGVGDGSGTPLLAVRENPSADTPRPGAGHAEPVSRCTPPSSGWSPGCSASAKPFGHGAPNACAYGAAPAPQRETAMPAAVRAASVTSRRLGS